MLIGIFGTGRNGSTLIGRLLDGIPDTYVHPVEVNFLSAMNDLAKYGRVSKLTGLNATTKQLACTEDKINVNILLRYYSYHFAELRDTYISQLLEGIRLGKDPVQAIKRISAFRPQEFVKRFLNAAAEWVNNNRPARNIVFKTIETPYIREYEESFPSMRFIHIIRNPVDVYSSAKRTLMFNKSLPAWYLGRDCLETMIEKRWLPHARTITECCPSERHYLVRYEDLVRDTKNAIVHICKWLHVSLPSHPQTQTVFGGKFIKKLPMNSSKRGVVTPVEVVSNLREVLKYEEVITNREKDFIMARTSAYMREIGYLDCHYKLRKGSLISKWILPEKWEILYCNSPYKMIKTIIAFFYRRYYIWRSLLMDAHHLAQ